MRVDTEDLVSLADIAQMFATSQTAVSNWQKRHDDFPEPVAIVGQDTRIFLRPDVIAWYGRKYPERMEALRQMARYFS